MSLPPKSIAGDYDSLRHARVSEDREYHLQRADRERQLAKQSTQAALRERHLELADCHVRLAELLS